MPELKFKEESYRIVGACFEVYNEMGAGFLESVYQESLAIEFGLQSISYVAQSELQLSYKGRRLVSKFIPDFIVMGKIIVELKALSDLTDQHRAQVHNYLKATQFELGLLVNFGQYPKLQYERIVR